MCHFCHISNPIHVKITTQNLAYFKSLHLNYKFENKLYQQQLEKLKNIKSIFK